MDGDGWDAGRGDALAGDRFAVHATRGSVPAADPSQATLAYDREQFPVLCSQIAAAVDAKHHALLLSALGIARRAVSLETKAAEAARAGLLDQLLALATYEDSVEARLRAADSVARLADVAGVRLVVAEADTTVSDVRVRGLEALISDRTPGVRLFGLQAIERLARGPACASLLVGGGITARVVDVLRREASITGTIASRAEAAALDALTLLAVAAPESRDGLAESLASEVPQVAVEALRRGRCPGEAARLLATLASDTGSRRHVFGVGAAEAVREYISRARPSDGGSGDDSPPLASVLALAALLAVGEEARHVLADDGSIAAPLRDLVDPRSSHVVVLHASRLVEQLCVLPSARARFRAAGIDVALLDVRDSPAARAAVVRAAADARAAVLWEP